MADLRPSRDRAQGRSDRAQIILVATLILAAAFVVLALIVNSAIFTENLATRSDVPGSNDALDYRHEVEQSVGNTIEAVNDNNSRLPSGDGAKDSVENISTQGGLQQSGLGSVVNVSFITRTSGTKVAQDNATRNFTSTLGDQNWDVVTSVRDVRNIRFNITDPGELSDIGLSPFRILINESLGTPNWELKIGENAGGDIELEVDTGNGDNAVCTRSNSGEPVTIDVSRGLFDGEPCHALTQLQDPGGTEMWFGTGVTAPNDIQFRNAQNIQGTYSFIVDASANPEDVNSGPSEDVPYETAAIYSMQVQYAYYTSAVVYETDITVTPEEVPP